MSSGKRSLSDEDENRDESSRVLKKQRKESEASSRWTEDGNAHSFNSSIRGNLWRKLFEKQTRSDQENASLETHLDECFLASGYACEIPRLTSKHSPFSETDYATTLGRVGDFPFKSSHLCRAWSISAS